MSAVKKWVGPVPINCDICHKSIYKTFIDGRTVYGPWANMCSERHSQVGVGLGTGKGAKV